MKRVETKLTLTNLTTKKDYFITLPVSEEELTKFIDMVSNNDKDDYIISDGFNEIKFFWFDVMKYDNINELNKFVKHLNECDEYEHDLIMALIDWGEISSLKDVYEVNLDDYKLEYDLHSYEDVGKFFYEMNFGAIPPMMEDVIEEYFDFKKYGKDIMQDTFYSTFCDKGVIFCIG
jgi:hypothetical protein